MMKKEIEFRYLKHGLSASIKTAWRPEFLDILIEKQIDELVLVQGSGGFNSCGLDFLRELPQLRSLLIYWHGSSVMPIHHLHELRSLRLITRVNHGIDFSAFPHLKECEFYWRSRSGSLFKQTGLETLTLDLCPRKDSRLLSGMTEMERLSLSSVRFADQSGLRKMHRLDHLWIKNCAALRSLDGLEDLENLTSLSLLYLNNVNDYNRISRLKKLRRIELLSVAILDTLTFLEDLTELEEINFMGKTDIRDGDLSFLRKLPKLRRIAYNHRGHYNVDPREFGVRFKGNA